jgi:hypothetical protein
MTRSTTTRRKTMTTQAAAKAQFLKENLKAGEHYVGLILGKAGEPDYHLILLPGEAQKIKWADALKWAKKAGGELPIRREQALLYANLKEEFQAAWYWSCEEHAAGPVYAWMQHFDYGFQDDYHKSYQYRARAVRRLKIL